MSKRYLCSGFWKRSEILYLPLSACPISVAMQVGVFHTQGQCWSWRSRTGRWTSPITQPSWVQWGEGPRRKTSSLRLCADWTPGQRGTPSSSSRRSDGCAPPSAAEPCAVEGASPARGAGPHLSRRRFRHRVPDTDDIYVSKMSRRLVYRQGI